MPRVLALLLASAGALAPGMVTASPKDPADSAWLRIDMDGDGLPDRFAMDRSGDKVVVTVALATRGSGQLEFTASDFHCSVVAQDPACGDVPHALEPMALAPSDIADLAMMFDLESADIFVGNGRAAAVSVQPGDTDPFIFFWNAKSKHLDWLRL